MLTRSKGYLKASRLLLTWVLKFSLSSEFYQGVKQLNCWYCPAKCYFICHPGECILKDFWLQCLKSSLTEDVSASFKTWCNAALIITVSQGDDFVAERLKQNSSLLSLDYSKGFGGKYGVDKDKVDKSAVGFEYQGKTEKHESQKGFYYFL